VRAAAPVVIDSNGGVDLEAAIAGIPELVEAGATQVSFPLAAFARRRDELPPLLERLARVP
jgi:hypothetical protein